MGIIFVHGYGFGMGKPSEFVPLPFLVVGQYSLMERKKAEEKLWMR